MNLRRLLSVCVLSQIGLAGGTLADEPTLPKPEFSKVCLLARPAGQDPNAQPPSPLAVLASHYNSGEWSELQDASERLLTELGACPGVPKGFPDRAFQHLIVFVDHSGSKPKLIRFLWPSAKAFSMNLGGLSGEGTLRQVFLSHNPEAKYSSQFTSKRQVSPLEASLPAFFKEFVSLEKLLPAMAQPEVSILSGPGARAVVKFYTQISVASVALPFARSKISVSEELTIPDVPGNQKVLVKLLEKAEEKELEAIDREGLGSPCVAGLATELESAFSFLLGPVCIGGDEPPSSGCWKAVETEIKRAYSTYIDRESESGGKCNHLNHYEVDRLLAVESSFLSLVTGKSPVKASFSYELANQPLKRLGLGVLTAAIVDDSGADDRAKIGADNKLVDDDLGTGPLSMGVLNIHPRRFDPELPKPSAQERFRFFVGVTVSPEFGLGAGAGMSLLRGLTLNVGYAALLIDTPRSGEVLGQPATTREPLTQGFGGVIFVGLGYDFKG